MSNQYGGGNPKLGKTMPLGSFEAQQQLQAALRQQGRPAEVPPPGGTGVPATPGSPETFLPGINAQGASPQGANLQAGNVQSPNQGWAAPGASPGVPAAGYPPAVPGLPPGGPVPPYGGASGQPFSPPFPPPSPAGVPPQGGGAPAVQPGAYYAAPAGQPYGSPQAGQPYGGPGDQHGPAAALPYGGAPYAIPEQQPYGGLAPGQAWGVGGGAPQYGGPDNPPHAGPVAGQPQGGPAGGPPFAGASPGPPPGQQAWAAGTPPQAQGAPVVGIQGFSGGMPRISVNTGDFSPTKLWEAVVTGQGFSQPRLVGLVAVAISILLVVANVALILVLERYYPYLFALAMPLGWGGFWLVLTGQPKARPDGQPAPMWTRLGLGAALGFGLLWAVAVVVFLSGRWF